MKAYFSSVEKERGKNEESSVLEARTEALTYNITCWATQAARNPKYRVHTQ